jgi:hypothetical protein
MDDSVNPKLGMSLDDLIAAEKPRNLRHREERQVGGRSRRPAADAPMEDDERGTRRGNVRRESPPARRELLLSGDMSLDDLIAAEKAGSRNSNRRERSPRARPVNSEKSEKFAKAFGVRRRGSSPDDSKTTVKVTNIPYDLTWKDIKSAFAEVGHVERCDVEDGVAWVVFGNVRDAQDAVRTYNGGEMNGRVIRVCIA